MSNQNTQEGRDTDSHTGESSKTSLQEEVNKATSEPNLGESSAAVDKEGIKKISEPNVGEPSVAVDKEATEGVPVSSQHVLDNEVGSTDLGKSKKSLRRISEIYQKLSNSFAYGTYRRSERRPFATPHNVPPPPHYYRGREERPNQTTRRNSNGNAHNNGNVHRIAVSSFSPVAQLTPLPAIFNTASGQWATYPPNILTNVPIGLSLLVDSDVLYVIQKIDFLSLLLSSIDDSHLYLVINKRGECVYYVTESFNLCASSSCVRSHQLHVMDVYNTEIMFLNLPCACTYCFCCYPILEVYSPPMVPLGAVVKVFQSHTEAFNILDSDENVMFKLYGSICPHPYTANDFEVHALDANGTRVGIIRREFASMPLPGIVDLDYYGVSFPSNMDVKVKALILASVILIDFTYYDTHYVNACPFCTCCICCF